MKATFLHFFGQSNLGICVEPSLTAGRDGTAVERIRAGTDDRGQERLGRGWIDQGKDKRSGTIGNERKGERYRVELDYPGQGHLLHPCPLFSECAAEKHG